VPTETQAKALPRLMYQLFFDRQTPEAVAELNRDIRRTLRGTMRDVASPPPESFLTSSETFIGAWDHVDEVCLLFFGGGAGCSLDRVLIYVFRSPRSHSSQKRRRIIGLSNTA